MKVQDLIQNHGSIVETLINPLPTPPPTKDDNKMDILIKDNRWDFMIKEKKFQCTYVDCGKIFTRLANLNSHLSVHSGERPFICKYDGCQGKFRRKQDLFRHTRSIHMPFSSRPYQCPSAGCLMRFARADGLSAHLRSCVGGSSRRRRKTAYDETPFSETIME
jgi:uncharacterized Zn-finger protein